MTTHTITPRGRVSYPKVFKAEFNNLSKKMEFSVDLLFPKSQDLTPIKQEIKRVIAERWPGQDMTGRLKLPIKDGDGLKSTGAPYGPEYHGHVFITFKTTRQPGVVDAQRQPISDPSEFQSGCYAVVHYSAFAYPKKGVTSANLGISLGLENIQKVAEGEPFGVARTPAEVAFSDQGSENPANYAAPKASQPFDPFA